MLTMTVVGTVPTLFATAAVVPTMALVGTTLMMLILSTMTLVVRAVMGCGHLHALTTVFRRNRCRCQREACGHRADQKKQKAMVHHFVRSHVEALIW